MARRRRRKWTVKAVTAKARERLHALRMKFKPGYAVAYLKSLGLNDREIAQWKAFGERAELVAKEKKRQGW